MVITYSITGGNDGGEWTLNPYEALNIPVEGGIRRPDRIANKNQPSTNFCAKQYISNDPGTVREALSLENSSK